MSSPSPRSCTPGCPAREAPPQPRRGEAPRAARRTGSCCAAARRPVSASVAGLHLTHGRAAPGGRRRGRPRRTLALRAACAAGRSAPGPAPARRAPLWTCWLLAYAAPRRRAARRRASPAAPTAYPTGTADAPWPARHAPPWPSPSPAPPPPGSRHLFAARARPQARRQPRPGGLRRRRTPPAVGAVRPLPRAPSPPSWPLTAPALDASPPYAETLALGALLFLARLLTVHGFTHAPAAVLAAAATAQAAALATVFAAASPAAASWPPPSRPLVDAWGAGAVPTLACGAPPWPSWSTRRARCPGPRPTPAPEQPDRPRSQPTARTRPHTSGDPRRSSAQLAT